MFAIGEHAQAVADLGHAEHAGYVDQRLLCLPRFGGVDQHGAPFQCGGELVRRAVSDQRAAVEDRSEEHTSELQSLMRISYAVFCLKQKKVTHTHNPPTDSK